MNYKKQQPSTLISRMGFNDPDLTSPKHDELVLSCTKTSIAKWVNRRCDIKFDAKEAPAYRELSKGPYEDRKCGAEWKWNGEWEVESLQHEWVLKDKNFVVGFIDVFVRLRRAAICTDG